MRQLKELIEKLGHEAADERARAFFNDADAFVSESHLFNGIEAITDIDAIKRFIAWIDGQ